MTLGGYGDNVVPVLVAQMIIHQLLFISGNGRDKKVLVKVLDLPYRVPVEFSPVEPREDVIDRELGKEVRETLERLRASFAPVRNYWRGDDSVSAFEIIVPTEEIGLTDIQKRIYTWVSEAQIAQMHPFDQDDRTTLQIALL